jgi:hypothetical protein
MRLLLACAFAALAWGQTLTLTGPPTARPGTTIPVTLALAAPPASLAAAQWTVGLPAGYTATAAAGAASTAAAKTLHCKPDSTLCLTVGVNANLYAAGVVATYQLAIPANASPGQVSIPLTGVIGAALDGSSAGLGAGVPFAFAVLARTDLNGDGVTDVLDLQLMIQEILGGPVAHDQNGDGLADVKDAQIVARAVLP